MKFTTLAPCLMCGVALAAERPSFAVKELPDASMRIHAGEKIVEALQAVEDPKLGPPGRRRANNLRGLAPQAESPSPSSSNDTDLVTFSDIFNDIFDPKLEAARHKKAPTGLDKSVKEAIEEENERHLAVTEVDADAENAASSSTEEVDKAKANAKAISWDVVFDPDLSNLGKRKKANSTSSSRASKEVGQAGERTPLPEAIQYKQGKDNKDSRALEEEQASPDTELFKFDDIFDPKLEEISTRHKKPPHLMQAAEGSVEAEGHHRVLKGGAALDFASRDDKEKVLAVLEKQIEEDMAKRAEMAKKGDNQAIADASNAP